MISKAELEKLKELASKANPNKFKWARYFWRAVIEWPDGLHRMSIAAHGPIYEESSHNIELVGNDMEYISSANPATVLRLIEALEVAIKSLIKIRVNCSCTELCMCSEDDVYIAQEALDKIYGQSE